VQTHTKQIIAGLVLAWLGFAAFLFFYNLPAWCLTPETSGVPAALCQE